MRLLAPNNRTKDGGVNDPRESLRHQIAEYGKELAAKVHEMNKARTDQAALKAKIEAEIEAIHSKRIETENTAKACISNLHAQIEVLKEDADVKKVLKRLEGKEKALESSMLAFEDERSAFDTVRNDVASSRKALIDYADELEETNKDLTTRHLSLELAKKSLDERAEVLSRRELSASEDERSLHDRITALEIEQSAHEKLVRDNLAELEFTRRNMDKEQAEITKEKIILKDKKVKLDSLIAFYERKTRRK